mmetsp:Transcript_7911/g.19671  ORF Transcript_7911/g.19671 Transcript_7911/m.19671 type:complete len:265 (+) Transcript_7911:463-1257(+)
MLLICVESVISFIGPSEQSSGEPVFLEIEREPEACIPSNHSKGNWKRTTHTHHPYTSSLRILTKPPAPLSPPPLLPPPPPRKPSTPPFPGPLAARTPPRAPPPPTPATRRRPPPPPTRDRPARVAGTARSHLRGARPPPLQNSGQRGSPPLQWQNPRPRGPSPTRPAPRRPARARAQSSAWEQTARRTAWRVPRPPPRGTWPRASSSPRAPPPRPRPPPRRALSTTRAPRRRSADASPAPRGPSPPRRRKKSPPPPPNAAPSHC